MIEKTDKKIHERVPVVYRRVEVTPELQRLGELARHAAFRVRPVFRLELLRLSEARAFQDLMPESDLFTLIEEKQLAEIRPKSLEVPVTKTEILQQAKRRYIALRLQHTSALREDRTAVISALRADLPHRFLPGEFDDFRWQIGMATSDRRPGPLNPSLPPSLEQTRPLEVSLGRIEIE